MGRQLGKANQDRGVEMMPVSEEQQVGRAKNAVLSFFEERLSIPKIYLDADWNAQRIDVLAINRDGVGDVHVALLLTRPYDEDGDLISFAESVRIGDLMKTLDQIPAHFKYIGAVDTESDRRNAHFSLPPHILEESLAPDGIGRIGYLKIDVPAQGQPLVRLEIKPERFRAEVARLADDYVEQHTADWEIRA